MHKSHKHNPISYTYKWNTIPCWFRRVVDIPSKCNSINIHSIDLYLKCSQTLDLRRWIRIYCIRTTLMCESPIRHIPYTYFIYFANTTYTLWEKHRRTILMGEMRAAHSESSHFCNVDFMTHAHYTYDSAQTYYIRTTRHCCSRVCCCVSRAPINVGSGRNKRMKSK